MNVEQNTYQIRSFKWAYRIICSIDIRCVAQMLFSFFVSEIRFSKHFNEIKSTIASGTVLSGDRLFQQKQIKTSQQSNQIELKAISFNQFHRYYNFDSDY